MKVLLDMNLSPAWVQFLEEHGVESVHWAAVGEPTAPDSILRRELPPRGGEPPLIRDLKIVDSRENVLIQLADMVAGPLRRHAEADKDDGELYRQAIASRLEDVWDFGRSRGGPEAERPRA